MNKTTTALIAGIISSGFITTASAGMIVPDNYVYNSSPNGEHPAYLDPNNTDLTDGVIATTGWGSYITTDIYKYVGWKPSDPEITFNFASTVSIGSLILWADDANGGAGVYLPTQVSISMGGDTVVRSIADPAGSVPIGISFDNLNLSGNSLTLNVTSAAGVWTMISEVQFVSSVPVPAAAWLFGSGLIGLIGVARRKKS